MSTPRPESAIDRRESVVRSYPRSFPASFARAVGAEVWDADGRRWIDLFSGAGALNYGHNDPAMKAALLDWIAGDGIAHALDLVTPAKEAFVEAFERIVLEPRDLPHRLMFPGPTGTNAVEAALKVARLATGRSTVAAFTNGFHGMTLGALAASGSGSSRAGAGVGLAEVVRLPFDGYFGPEVETLGQIERLLDDSSSGVDAPAAFLVETVQAEGGVRPASAGWLQGLSRLARSHGSLLVVDDVQAGCGRAGTFFSFDRLGVMPDVICLAKSLSGFGLPLALVLLRPELDVWKPGQHNGTFRGNNHALVTARVALERYWAAAGFEDAIAERCERVSGRLSALAGRVGGAHRGRGLLHGLELPGGAARRASRAAFEDGVLAETAGPCDEVLKIMPPLTIPTDLLDEALDTVEAAVVRAMREDSGR